MKSENGLAYLISLFVYSLMWIGIFKTTNIFIYLIEGVIVFLWLAILFICIMGMRRKVILTIIPLLLIPVIYVFPWIIVAIFIVLIGYIDLFLLLRMLAKVSVYHLIGDNFGDMGTT